MTMGLGWFTVHTKGSQIRLCNEDIFSKVPKDLGFIFANRADPVDLLFAKVPVTGWFSVFKRLHNVSVTGL